LKGSSKTIGWQAFVLREGCWVLHVILHFAFCCCCCCCCQGLLATNSALFLSLARDHHKRIFTFFSSHLLCFRDVFLSPKIRLGLHGISVYLATAWEQIVTFRSMGEENGRLSQNSSCDDVSCSCSESLSLKVMHVILQCDIYTLPLQHMYESLNRLLIITEQSQRVSTKPSHSGRTDSPTTPSCPRPAASSSQPAPLCPDPRSQPHSSTAAKRP
jgi:hypothetical protein